MKIPLRRKPTTVTSPVSNPRPNSVAPSLPGKYAGPPSHPEGECPYPGCEVEGQRYYRFCEFHQAFIRRDILIGIAIPDFSTGRVLHQDAIQAAIRYIDNPDLCESLGPPENFIQTLFQSRR